MDSKKIFTLICCLLTTVCAFGQAKKPTLMVVPSDIYCINKGFSTTVISDGEKETVPDYAKALQNDHELLIAITEIGKLMADRGFPLKNLEMELKNLVNDNAEDEMLTSKSGADLKETAYERLRKRAKCDILLNVTWKINKLGPKKSITFTLQGLDAYTNKQIAACQGTGEPSYSAELPVLLQEAIINELPEFQRQLQSHFEDLFENGREIKVRCRVWDDYNFDFESEFGGKELGEIIEDWFASNTEKGRFSLSEASENVMDFDQVRIPLYDNRGRATDARNWSRGLINYLMQYGVPAKLITKGLGYSQIIIGGK